jgi:nitric-oxide synthase
MAIDVLSSVTLRGMQSPETLYQKATSFIKQLYQELDLSGMEERLNEIKIEIEQSGTYTHSFQELEHGVRIAWRNSNRCIGRLYWKSLILNDKRNVRSTKDVFHALEEHLTIASNNGKILPLITVFPPQQPNGITPFRIWNKNLIRYAAHQEIDGSIIGDPEQLSFTHQCKQLGWKGNNSPFDLLPIVIQENEQVPQWHSLNPSLVLEVAIEHPEYKWFADLQLKWHAVPLISDMVLEVGGIEYPAAPFNGWYMVTEIGSRNLGDEKRYNQLPLIAERLGLKQDKSNPFWKDKALVVLNEAVHYSFQNAGVTLADHHAASEQFMKFMRNEEAEGRAVKADWSWIVPPLSGSALKVFHQEYDNEMITPNFFYNNKAWESKTQKSKCPFHKDSIS